MDTHTHFLSIPLCGSQLCFAHSYILTALKKVFLRIHTILSHSVPLNIGNISKAMKWSSSHLAMYYIKLILHKTCVRFS